MPASVPLILRFAVPADAPHPSRLCLFGAKAGGYPFDPTIIIHTEKDLPEQALAAAGPR